MKSMLMVVNWFGWAPVMLPEWIQSARRLTRQVLSPHEPAFQAFHPLLFPKQRISHLSRRRLTGGFPTAIHRCHFPEADFTGAW